MENKTYLIYGDTPIYKWGKGYSSIELKNEFEEMVEDFCYEWDLTIVVSKFGAQKVPNEIYFHPMEIVFKNEYNIKPLINSFIEYMENTFYVKPKRILEK